MTARPLRYALTAVALIGLAAATASTRLAGQGGQAGQAVFRGATDLVTVDVSVRSQGTPIAGLEPADFVLLDNGIRQTVERLDVEAVPVDVSILLDTNQGVADDVRGFPDEVRRIAALLRPSDRLRVMTIGHNVADLVPVQTAAELPEVRQVAAHGLASAHDGIAAALIRSVDPNRRHLVIALTNGIDEVSALPASAVRDLARRSNATLYPWPANPSREAAFVLAVATKDCNRDARTIAKPRDTCSTRIES